MTIESMSTEALVKYATAVHKSIDPVDKALISELAKRLQGKNVVPIKRKCCECGDENNLINVNSDVLCKECADCGGFI